MPDFNMPIEQDVQGSEAVRNRRFTSVFYTPQPTGKTQGIAHNKLYFALFSPASWPIFQPREGVVLANSVPSSLGTFYWKFHVHYAKVRLPDGSTRDGQPIICPPKQNTFHVDVLKYGPMFADTRCRVCEEAVAWWGKFDAEWGRTTYNGQLLGNRWDYQREQFNQIVNGNPVLKQLHEEANYWTQSVRWIYIVLDLSKAMGERKLDPDATGVQFEPFMSSKQVFDGLKTLVDQGVRFFDPNNPQIVVLTKDTSKGWRFAKYSVSNLGPWQADPAFKAYIGSEANLPTIVGGRPGEDDAQLFVLSYEEQREFLGLTGDPGSGSMLQQQATSFNYGANAPATGTGMPAPSPVQPVQPYVPPQPQPQQSPPVQPYVPPQPASYVQPPQPVAPPPAAAPPVAPVAPIAAPQSPVPAPVAPAPAPVPIAAPQPAPVPIAAPQPPVPAAAPLASAPQAAPADAPAPAPAPAATPAPAPGGGNMPKPRRRGQTNW